MIILGGAIFSIIIMIIGIVPLVVNYKKCHSNNFCEDTGIIIDYEVYGEFADKSYAPVIGYNVNGKNYKIIGNSQNKKPKMMTSIKIMYDSNNPDDCVIKNDKSGLSWVLSGIVFLIISIISQFLSN